MAREKMALGRTSGAWTDGEKFTGRFTGDVLDWIPVKRNQVKKGDKTRKSAEGKIEKQCDYLSFVSDAGAILRKNATKAWHDAIAAKAFKAGDVLEVIAEREVKAGGGRFRPFTIVRLTGADIPKGLR